MAELSRALAVQPVLRSIPSNHMVSLTILVESGIYLWLTALHSDRALTHIK